MQNPLGAAQTAQWSWILQTVWGWVWGGLSWILDWQAYVFQFVLSGSSFWGAVGRFLFLFFPAVMLVAGRGGEVGFLFHVSVRLWRGGFFLARPLVRGGAVPPARCFWVWPAA